MAETSTHPPQDEAPRDPLGRGRGPGLGAAQDRVPEPADGPDATLDVDVAVVGMGPVGKMMALLTARAGHRVLVCDRKDATYALPRAVAHDAEIARLWQSAGLPPDAMPEAVEPYDDLYVWVDRAGETLMEIDWSGPDPSGWNTTYFYHQPSLEARLDQQMETHADVVVRRPFAAVVRGQDADGVDLLLEPTRADGKAGGAAQPIAVRARYVVGADGAASPTRAAVGAGWTDLGFYYDWLVVDVVPGPGVEVTHLAKQVCDPVRPTTVVPAGPGRRRWEFMLLDGEDKAEISRPERIWELLAPFGLTAGNSTLERGVVYTFQSGWATPWQDRRVFLVGDAAHQMPPFAGQGMAAGLRDCLNLAWKMDAVLRGAAAPSLLGTYTDERTVHVSDFIDFSMSLGKIICITDPAAAAARDEAMLTAIRERVEPAPPPAPHLGPGLHLGPGDPVGGTLSRQGRITTADHAEPVRYDDVFGPGALVLADAALADHVTAEQRAVLEGVGVRVTTFDTAGSNGEGAARFADAEGGYAAWLSELGAAAVLVRPDFYVYGTAADAASLEDLVAGFVAGVSGRVAAATA